MNLFWKISMGINHIKTSNSGIAPSAGLTEVVTTFEYVVKFLFLY
jgi:hypothetical protein